MTGVGAMIQTGFETTMPMFERAKAVHASNRAATVIGYTVSLPVLKFYKSLF
jgi:hypothetical protein